MAEQEITTKCAHCGVAGDRERFYWMAYADFCEPCIRRFAKLGWARPEPGPSRRYELTESGGKMMPDLVPVAYCGLCGKPIYKRSIEDGTARGLPEPACPYCLRNQQG